MINEKNILTTAWRDYRACWKQLAVTDIAYKAVAYVLLTPLAGLLFTALIGLSGRTVLADEDIAKFLLEPLGWVCGLTVASLWIAIVAWEQAALMHVVQLVEHGKRPRLLGTLAFALARAIPVTLLALRALALAILAATPFLLAGGVTYWLLLSDFDINFYLSRKPWQFQVAVSIAATLGLGLAAVLLYLTTSWFYALPMVIFERVSPRQALGRSHERARGRRRRILFWITLWLAVTFAIGGAATGLLAWASRLVILRVEHNLPILLSVVGAGVVIWLLLHLALNLLSTTSFAVVFLRLYAEVGESRGDATLSASSIERSSAIGRFVFRWLSPKRFVIAVVIGIIASSGFGYLALHSVPRDQEALLVAHRGASAVAPENTMAAIRQAVAEGADSTEIDVQENADGTIVVFHDSDFKKLANDSLKIWNATDEDLESIDIGSWFDPRFRNERVPTLAEVLTYCRGKIGVTIELKYYGHDRRLEQKVVQVVEAHDMADDVTIISLKPAGLRKLQQLRPSWKTGLLTAVALGDLTKVDADFLAVSANIGSRTFIRSAHRRNKQVWVWTVNDPLTMSTMIGRGADGLITDEPGLARDVLTARHNLTSVERLLLEVAGAVGMKREVLPQ